MSLILETDPPYPRQAALAESASISKSAAPQKVCQPVLLDMRGAEEAAAEALNRTQNS